MKHGTAKFWSIVLSLALVLSLIPAVVSHADGGAWVEVAAADLEAGNVVIITMEKGSNIWGLDNDNGTGSAPSAIALNVSDSKLTGTDEELANCTWTVGLSEGNLLFTTTNTNGGNLYCTNTNNGVRVGGGDNKAFKIDATSGYLVNVGTSRYIGVYSSQDWRCYSTINDNIKEQTLRFWMYEEATTPTNLPTIYGADTDSLPIAFVENGARLYRFDVSIRNLPDDFAIVGGQVFLAFDTDLLALERIESKFSLTQSMTENKLMVAWASEGEMTLVNDQVLFSLIFSLKRDAAGEETDLVFVENAQNEPSSLSVIEDGGVANLEVATIDGQIRFAEAVLGDANEDGLITSADAAMILRTIVGLSELTLQGELNADVDGDLEVTAADAALVLQYVVGLINAFPAA